MKKIGVNLLAIALGGLLARGVLAQSAPPASVPNAFAVLPWSLGFDGRVSVCDKHDELNHHDRCVGVGLGGPVTSAPRKMGVQEALEEYLKDRIPPNMKPVLVGVAPVLNPPGQLPVYAERSFIVYYRIGN